MDRVVGINEMYVSKDVNDVLVTYSLGSCVGISLFDPEVSVGGMIHCMLPMSKIDPEKAKTSPTMYTDTGFVVLLQSVLELGANKDRIVTKVAGCGAPMDRNGRFKIGDRNYAVLRKLLWKNKMLIEGEDVGGTQPRTMRLFMDSGKTTISTSGKVTKL